MSESFGQQHIPQPEDDANLSLENATQRLSNEPRPEDEQEQHLSFIDHLLQSAPLVIPKPEFAERVVEAIRNRDLPNLNRYSATGLILGLGTASGVVIYLLIAVGLAIINLIINWNSIYRGLVWGTGSLVNQLYGGLRDFNMAVTDSPVLITLGILSIPLGFIWLRLFSQMQYVEAEQE